MENQKSSFKDKPIWFKSLAASALFALLFIANAWLGCFVSSHYITPIIFQGVILAGVCIGFLCFGIETYSTRDGRRY